MKYEIRDTAFGTFPAFAVTRIDRNGFGCDIACFYTAIDAHEYINFLLTIDKNQRKPKKRKP